MTSEETKPIHIIIKLLTTKIKEKIFKVDSKNNSLYVCPWEEKLEGLFGFSLETKVLRRQWCNICKVLKERMLHCTPEPT